MSAIKGITNPRGTDVDENIDENEIDIKSMQVLRKSFIKQLAVDGIFPSDPENRTALIALMKDTTASAISSKRIKADEKTATSNAQVAANMAEAVRIAMANKAAAHRSNRAVVQDVVSVPVKMVPGHTDVGILPINTAAIAAGTLNKEA